MTQISTLVSEFETAFETLQMRLSTPQTSDAETQLSKDLEAAQADITRVEGELEKQQDQYLSLSEEYGAMELSLVKLQSDDTADREKAELQKQLETLKFTNEATIEMMVADNKALQAKLDVASEQSADHQVAFKSAQAASAKSDLDQVIQQHEKDIADVQDILKKLKPLVEE
jgi:hypothetical protein